ncbi:MAG: hypothetical protein KGH88_05355 [Thaumarchaeota archaeon]|nr:hypothetical protein [Nitrososphaerota archaeon]
MPTALTTTLLFLNGVVGQVRPANKKNVPQKRGGKDSLSFYADLQLNAQLSKLGHISFFTAIQGGQMHPVKSQARLSPNRLPYCNTI